MTKSLLGVVFAGALVLAASAAEAQELSPLDAKRAQRFGKGLAKAAAKIKNPQVAISADPAKSVGVTVSEVGGVVLVPQKGMAEGADVDLAGENGVGLGYYFSTSRIVPVIGGQLVERSKLYPLTVTDSSGNEHEINCMLLAVRKISEEDYRLYAFGSAKKPLIDVKFKGGKGPGDKPLAVEIKDVSGQTGSIVITVFDKYQATFKGGATSE